MSKTTRTFKHRILALMLACAMVVTGVMVGGPASVQAENDATANTVYRVYGSSRYDTSISVAEQIRAEMGVKQFDAVILATGKGFADALSGSYLSYVKNAPILLIEDNQQIPNNIRSYIRWHLKDEGTIYVLGGTGAVPDYMVDFTQGDTGVDPNGFKIVRLSGKSRYETNLEILKEAGINSEMEAGQILVSTGINYADSLSAAGAKQPILLVGNTLTDGQKEFLSELPEGTTYRILGGAGAVSEELAAELQTYGETDRITGKSRYETSVNIAKEFSPEADSVVLAYGGNFPDGLCGGLLATLTDSPIILTAATVNPATEDYFAESIITTGYALGGSGVVKDEVITQLFNVEPADVHKVYWNSKQK